jgi:hypothetical protein
MKFLEKTTREAHSRVSAESRSKVPRLSLNGSSIVHYASGLRHLLLIASRDVNNIELSVADGMQYRYAWTPPPRIYPVS